MLGTLPLRHIRLLSAVVVVAFLSACTGGGCCNVPAFNPDPTPTPSHRPSPSPKPSQSPTPSPKPSHGPTPSPKPSHSPTPAPSGSPVPTPTPLSCAQNAITGQGVPIGTDDTFAVLAGATVTNSGPTLVTGNLGVSPGSAVTGFGAGQGTVTGGSIYTGVGSPAGQAQADLTVAYNNAAGRVNPTPIPNDIGGLTLAPGLYKAPASIAITGTVTLDGQNNVNSVFIFQSPATLVANTNSKVKLINHANACNIFWQVSSSATLDASSNFSGIILAHASISVLTGTAVNGRLLTSIGQVSLLSDTVTQPGVNPNFRRPRISARNTAPHATPFLPDARLRL